MDRSRRQGMPRAQGPREAKPTRPPADAPPTASRLTIRSRKNSRRPSPVWSRVPKPRAIADACGRAVRRSLSGIAATAGIAVIAGGAWLGYAFITTSNRFAITSIEVRGTSQITADDVRVAIPARIGDNVFA